MKTGYVVYDGEDYVKERFNSFLVIKFFETRVHAKDFCFKYSIPLSNIECRPKYKPNKAFRDKRVVLVKGVEL